MIGILLKNKMVIDFIYLCRNLCDSAEERYTSKNDKDIFCDHNVHLSKLEFIEIIQAQD